MIFDHLTRRQLLTRVGVWVLLTVAGKVLPGCAVQDTIVRERMSPATLMGDIIDLTIEETPVQVDGRTGSAITINGTIPGPLIRLREGQEATFRVTNRLKEATSIHWHGILLPPHMDGVPGVSFHGIEPGETFTYRFPVNQSGTYWFHSHSGGQELLGMYAPLIIDPIRPDPYPYDRDYVVMLSDWTFESPETVHANLKKQPDYYNFQRRTTGEFIRDVRQLGWWPAVQNYVMWDRMRMNPTDFADVTGYTFTYLMNGLSPADNWTGLFRPGERVRLRFINGATMTFYDVRIPGLPMTVVQADGQPVEPFVVDEFRMGPAETYDVLIEPAKDHAYTIFAETMDRSGYARGTLATRAGLTADLPARRPRPLRSMADMGMSMPHADMSSMKMGETHHPTHVGMLMPQTEQSNSMHHAEKGQANPGQPHSSEVPETSEIPGSQPVRHGPDHHGPGNQMVAETSQARLDTPGTGLEGMTHRVLRYTDLRSVDPYPDQRTPERELELHLTGNMGERYLWSFDGKKYSDAPDPIRFQYGERLRLTFVNDTMMEHPLHLHGMWMYLENGHGAYLPRKHTVIVKPAERVSVAISADAPGRWAFHCHLLLHMESGMFRVIEVAEEKGPHPS
jgi:CopA family copper-resistance protein